MTRAQNRWLHTKDLSGEAYDARYDRRAAAGENVHGEADLVMRFTPASVLDAGCGTGRVARELAHRGVDVVGVDHGLDMLATARRRSPELRGSRTTSLQSISGAPSTWPSPPGT